jgi:hypothetical protein
MIAVKEVQIEAEGDPLIATITRLHNAGFKIIPLGHGKDGKEPSIKGWKRRQLPLRSILKRMSDVGTRMYGVRLDGRIVVDTDTDNERTRRYVSERFPEPAFMVRTSRGMHRYYAYSGKPPTKVREDGIAIDFKAGSGSYVVGPGSERPDGVRHETNGDLATAKLSEFRTQYVAETATYSSGKVPVTNRWDNLWPRALQLAQYADSLDGLAADLIAIRNIEFEEPASFGDAEVMKAAEWAWDKRIKDQIWIGRKSEFRMDRMVTDKLITAGDCDAYALYSVLQSNHGHIPDYEFAIVAKAMAGRVIGICARRITAAKLRLAEIGLIRLVRTGKRGKGIREPDKWKLVKPSIALTAPAATATERKGLTVTLGAKMDPSKSGAEND